MKEYKSNCTECGEINFHSNREHSRVACLSCATLYEPLEQVFIINDENKKTKVIDNQEKAQPRQMLISVEHTNYEQIQAINAISQVFGYFDLTHNEEIAISEWVWMAYGRGANQ